MSSAAIAEHPCIRSTTLHVGGAIDPERRRGRGAVSNASGRYERLQREVVDDGWGSAADLPAFKTVVSAEKARSIITRNDSPDLSFDRSVNPYRGCEHGCSYCFARPSHAYLGLSPGMDFEAQLFAKHNAAEVLERELSATGYQARTMALGTNTDPYQPIERTHRITRQVLEVLARFSHPVGIVTKSALVTRDIDILAPMAARGLAKVAVSVTTLDRSLARSMEPRAPSPDRRLDAIRQLSEAGIPVTVLVAPVIPAVNDSEIESILERARQAGAVDAGYVMLRLPLEVRDIFREWLMANRPGSLRHVMSLVQSTRGGKDYDSTWALRQTGDGPLAWLTGRRFEVAAARLGYNRKRTRLRTDLFEAPKAAVHQLQLL
jgi:DNA repair photolyase